MRTSLTLAALFATALAAPASAQQRDFSTVEIRAEQIKPGLAVLFGAGGNMAVSHGPDGTVLIDDQFAPLTPKIEKAVADLGATPVRFLINTHWHGDHTGGNENLGRAGALIMAHDNVRVRMATGSSNPQRPVPAAPAVALPVVTYDKGLKLHLNGDELRTIAHHGGHTDGDSVVMWKDANVLHTGDLFVTNPGFPYVDTTSGGNALHLLMTLDALIALVDENTVIIPGHGQLARKPQLVAWRDKTANVIEAVRALRAQTKTLDEIIALKPAAPFGADGQGIFSADRFVTAVYNSLAVHDAHMREGKSEADVHGHGPNH